MAVDFGTSNTTRYYSVPDHADFTLPDADWTWLALVRPQTPGTVSNYAISTGDWGAVNSFNLYTYGTTSGVGVKVDTIGEVQVSGNALPLNTWHWIYAVRLSGSLNCGQIALSASAVTESGAVPIVGAFNSATGPQIGRRAAGLVRNWNGQWSQVAFIPGYGISDAQVVELANGAPLLAMPFAPSIKFFLHGKNAADAAIADLIAGKVATKQGTSYGTSEEDAQTPYVWVPEYIRGAAVASGHSLTGSASTQANISSAASITQAHVLTGATSTQGNLGSGAAITLGAVNTLIGAASAQGNASGAGAIAQTHVLTASTSTNNGTSSAVAITQVHILSGANATQGNLGGADAISILVPFVGAPSNQANLSGVGQITRTQTLTGASSTQANLSGTGAISDGIVVESSLTTGIAETIRIKKPGIPAGTPEWLRNLLEILIGRRGNKITPPAFQTLTFSATPTKAECEALYSYTNEIRTAVNEILTRLDS